VLCDVRGARVPRSDPSPLLSSLPLPLLPLRRIHSRTLLSFLLITQAVTEAINRILQPVRDHFATGEPKKLLEKIKKFKVTR